MGSCRAVLQDGVLTLENRCLRRQYAWNDGHLIGQQIVDLATGYTWLLDGRTPDLALPGEHPEPRGGSLTVTPLGATPIVPAHLQVDATTHLGALEVRRRFRIYPGCPAIACDLYLRGKPASTWHAASAAAGDLENVEDQEALGRGRLGAVTMERIGVPGRHLELECVQFYDVTDRRNNLVASRRVLPYRREGRLAGSLLFVHDLLDGACLFLLKEAPCSDVQLAWPGCDYVHQIGEIRVVGIGVEPSDLREEEWTRCYGFVTGVAAGGEYAALSALRSYQERVRTHLPGRDHMVLLNTWGDRGQDTRIGESFALAELERASRLGITHVQLDDGWQAGRSSNSAFEGGSLQNIWEREDYWTPHPERFPNGLHPVVARSRERGIELCLWFNPSAEGGYAHWRQDAEALIALYREYGIRTFKIDGVMIPDKRADRNLRAMFERVMQATGGAAVFNLDVTAGRRWGYHYGNEYGNIFLENRYTDWGNYYPHWTLRNLWMLSRCVPPQNLQIEFLNVWRNPERYPPGDPLAPQRVPFEYCLAIALMAQPLAWFEATGLPDAAFEIAPAVRIYREHQECIHAGQIFPIGEEPSGTGWTGFQSIREGGGYLIVYREWNDRGSARLKLWALQGQRIALQAVAGQGSDFTALVDENGYLEVSLSAPFTYALYAYRILEDGTVLC